MIARSRLVARLSRKEWALVALGLAVWIVLGVGGVWFVHAVTRPKASCGNGGDAQTTQAKGSTAPGNGFKVLTGGADCQ